MSTDVLEGQDGWLFLVGGSNIVVTLYDRRCLFLSDAKLQQWVDLMQVRARRLERMGIQYVHINVPCKLTIYDHKLTIPPIIDWTLSPAVRLRELVHRSPYARVWLDLIEPFRAARDQQPIYYKTDSHWSGEGCFLAYKLLCEKIGIAPVPAMLARRSREVEVFLDLGSKMEPPMGEHIKAYDYAQDSNLAYANSVAQYLKIAQAGAKVHVGSHVRYRNDSPGAAKKKVLIFGDSYSNSEPGALTGMLAETVRDVEFVWSSNFDWSYIRRTRPDVVIFELVERFMTVLANDRLNLRWNSARQGLRANWLRFKDRVGAASAKA